MNILFLMADQLSARALSAYGGRLIHTQHLDRLAAQGTLFENASCTWPVSSPSRASILTGQYPHAHGITRNVDHPGLASITNDTPFTENLLAHAGYTTAYVGRWHTGRLGALDCFRGDAPSPNHFQDRDARQRDHYFTDVLPSQIQNLRLQQPVIPLAKKAGSAELVSPPQLCQETTCMTPAVWQAHQRWQASPKALYPILSLIGRSIIPPAHQPEALFADRIIEKLHEIRGKPFMMTWSVNAPHDPVVAPEPYYSFLPRTPALLPANHDHNPPAPLAGTSRCFVQVVGRDVMLEHLAVYFGLVKFIDDQVGRMLAALDELGLADDTLVLFTADHGDMLGSHGMVYKSTYGFFEEITQVPLIVRCPRRIPAGRRIAAPVSLLDLSPTLLDYAGLPVPPSAQGVSLRPLIEGAANTSPHPVICQRQAGRMVRVEQWKYAWYDNGIQGLFDLADDPGETRNLIDDASHADVVTHLRTLLRQEMQRTADPLLSTVFS
ncbi:MAG: sulfatase-like hydrolase/transferase [Phycisphaeraceae bacterium]|nr:sulfatase-like hydrolase/transferase [Phycisphaeraceae bacterium]